MLPRARRGYMGTAFVLLNMRHSLVNSSIFKSDYFKSRLVGMIPSFHRLIFLYRLRVLFLIAIVSCVFTGLLNNNLHNNLDSKSSSCPCLRKNIKPPVMHRNLVTIDNETEADRYIVPNIVHYVRFNKNNFSFTDYIALRAAYLHQEPESIYIHTNLAGPEYFTGKYWQLIQEEYALRSRIRIVECQLPRQVFGQNLSSDWHVKHGSDLTRIRIMIKYGGIYLDNKVFLIQRLDKYRKFEISMQWNDGQFLENQVNIKNLTNIMFQFLIILLMDVILTPRL